MVKINASYYQLNKEKIKKRMKKYWQTKKGKETKRKANKKFRQSEKGKKSHIKSFRKQRIVDFKKVKARDTLHGLFRYGNISNTEFICAVCGKQPIEKHHENYDI